MNHKSILAVLVVAAFVIAVVPMVSDGADAAKMTDGSNGAGFEVKNMSGEDLNKLIPVGWQLSYAEGILGSIIQDDVANYDITEVVVTEFCETEYQAEKIEGHEASTVDMHDVSYKISFKATCNSAVQHTLLSNDEKNQDLLKEIGIDNLSQEGAVFTISATVKNVDTEQYKSTYEANKDSDLVMVKSWEKNAYRDVTDSDVTYKFNDGTADKTIRFSASLGYEYSAITEVTYDFLDVAIADVTDMTRAIFDMSISEYGSHNWDTVTFNDNELGFDVYKIDPQDDPGYMSIGYANPYISNTDISVGEFHFYGDSGTCIFTPYTTTLDEDALKTLINTYGSWSEGDYGAAQSAADSSYKDISYMDELALALIIAAVVIGVFAILFLILIIVVIVLLVKRKKK